MTVLLPDENYSYAESKLILCGDCGATVLC